MKKGLTLNKLMIENDINTSGFVDGDREFHASELGYRLCDCCNKYQGACEFELSSGMGTDDVCLHCFETNSSSEFIQDALKNLDSEYLDDYKDYINN